MGVSLGSIRTTLVADRLCEYLDFLPQGSYNTCSNKPCCHILATGAVIGYHDDDNNGTNLLSCSWEEEFDVTMYTCSNAQTMCHTENSFKQATTLQCKTLSKSYNSKHSLEYGPEYEPMENNYSILNTL